MNDTRPLRAAVAGLLSFAAAEEQALLLAAPRETGSPDRWAAAPLVAHNNQFKSQQAERLSALRSGHIPPAFAEVDHSSPEVYQGYCALASGDVLLDCRRVSTKLIDGMWALGDDDLLDPARHPWLNGRLLWLQIIVRGFWHPTGHLGEYYLDHGQPERAVALAEHGLATARYLGAPEQAAGMAGYSLACALARAGRLDEAARVLAAAIGANPDLRVNAGRDPDLAGLREAGLVEALR
ncbi:MAG TPA: hypothetical protein VIX15_05970 [Streptosporangiaceae bacterium]